MHYLGHGFVHHLQLMVVMRMSSLIESFTWPWPLAIHTLMFLPAQVKNFRDHAVFWVTLTPSPLTM